MFLLSFSALMTTVLFGSTRGQRLLIIHAHLIKVFINNLFVKDMRPLAVHAVKGFILTLKFDAKLLLSVWNIRTIRVILQKITFD